MKKEVKRPVRGTILGIWFWFVGIAILSKWADLANKLIDNGRSGFALLIFLLIPLYCWIGFGLFKGKRKSLIAAIVVSIISILNFLVDMSANSPLLVITLLQLGFVLSLWKNPYYKK